MPLKSCMILTIFERRYEKLAGYLFNLRRHQPRMTQSGKEEAVPYRSEGQLEGDALRASSALWISVMRTIGNATTEVPVNEDSFKRVFNPSIDTFERRPPSFPVQ